jgi:hypothetical protein
MAEEVDSNVVHLNGGPWHDRLIALEPGVNFFRVYEAHLDLPSAITADQAEYPEIDMQEYVTVYTRVGHTQEFEWIGKERR